MRDGWAAAETCVHLKHVAGLLVRTLHSAVHCTFNLVILRFYLYLIATLAVWFMLLRAIVAFP